ncbi:MAG: hypothetical protein HYU60_04230 [Magnetospirillum sp.]|nr:hypothetical protein [Magnetospirillum sp.]
MSRTIPEGRVPMIAAWLAARGHDLVTAPDSLVALAIDEPYWPGDQEIADRHDPFGDNQRWPQGDPPPYAR